MRLSASRESVRSSRSRRKVCLDSILLRGFAPRHGDAALQKPGHFGLHMSAKEREQATLLASASHTVAERVGINGYV